MEERGEGGGDVRRREGVEGRGEGRGDVRRREGVEERGEEEDYSDTVKTSHRNQQLSNSSKASTLLT